MKKILTLMLLLWINTLLAKNLIDNSAFDANIDHWSNSAITATWVNNDGAATSGNGSMSFETTFSNGGSIWMQSDYMPVHENYQYILATSYKIPTSSMANYLYITIDWYDENQEFIGEYPYFGIEPSFDISQRDVWLDFDGQWQSIVEGSKFARVSLYIGLQTNVNGVSKALFDDVILFEDTIFMSEFD